MDVQVNAVEDADRPAEAEAQTQADEREGAGQTPGSAQEAVTLKIRVVLGTKRGARLL